jgi:hypothetical protein
MLRNAIVGGVVWCGLLAVALTDQLRLTWIEMVFLLAPLVIVPLGLHLTDEIEKRPRTSLPERWAKTIHAPAAGLAVASFFAPPGIIAAGLAAAWFLWCLLIAFAGSLRIMRGAFQQLDSLDPAVSFLYAAVGGAWLLASRLGLNPIGFQEPIVLLTAIHFHYAGFAAPLLARSVGRVLVRPGGNFVAIVLFRTAVTGVLLGPCLLAMGFVFDPRWKLAAALVLAASEVGLAISFIAALNRLGRLSAEIAITLAAASVAFSMALAAVWAIGEYPLHPFVHLDQMERLHGTANAFGFTLCGLLGWILAVKSDPDERMFKS